MQMKNKVILLSLAAASAVLMSVPFLVPHCGFFALFGLVPLLCMERIASLTGERRVWMYHYGCFVLWNAITTFWVCNATVGGGIFAVFANAFQMSVVFGLFRWSKKYFRGILPYIFLMVTWIAWERAYFDADISWPWLVLGNAFARSIESIQWYEYTGALGGSLWVWLSNLSIFGMMAALSDGTWAHRFNLKAKVASVAGLALLLAAPFVLSKVIYNSYEEQNEGLVDVLVFQPNIDPYNKFQAMSRAQQDALLIGQMRAALDARRDSLGVVEPECGVAGSAAVLAGSDCGVVEAQGAEGAVAAVYPPVLLLAPETFTSGITMGNYESNMTWRRFADFLKDYPEADLLFGASTFSIITSSVKPSHTARQLNDGRWYESHNSALMMDGSGRTEIFHKNKLVVAVEMTPYPAVFCPIDDLLGGVMGRCVGQGSAEVLHCAAWGAPEAGSTCGGAPAAAPCCSAAPAASCGGAPALSRADSVALGCAICYESVYGEYYTEYVRKGAEFMTIITNDAWWGDTPGYRQHLSYASLRAIETRRGIARCANTGISAFIDQRGVIHDASAWWRPAVLSGQVARNSALTFYVTHGDIAGRLATFLFCLLFLALLVRLLKK